MNVKFTYHKPVRSPGCIVSYERVLLGGRRKKKNKLKPDYIVIILIRLNAERYKTYIENASAGNWMSNYSKKYKVSLSAIWKVSTSRNRGHS